MADAHVPARSVVGVVPGEKVHVRVDRDGERIAQSGREDLQLRAVGPDAEDAAAPLRKRGAVLALGPVEPVVADGDVDPAVDAHADAVGRVVAAALVDLAGRQARDQHLLPVGDAVAVARRQTRSETAGAGPRPSHPARSRLAGAPSSRTRSRGRPCRRRRHRAADNPAASRRAAERALLVHGDIHRTVRRHRRESPDNRLSAGPRRA